MKKITVALLIVIGVFTHSSIYANDNRAASILLGTAGGALVGQAVGHNAESTIIGAAIGSVLGIVAHQPSHHKKHYRPIHYRPYPGKPDHYKRYNKYRDHHRSNSYSSPRVFKKTTIVRTAPYYERTVSIRSYGSPHRMRPAYSEPRRHHPRSRW